MAEFSLTNGQDALEEKLGRLAKKPGVKASIVLDRSSGAILKTSGDVSALGTVKSRSASTAASFSSEIPVTNEDESQGIQDFAAAIWKYVKSSDHVLEELDTEDELRLLRVRTKKQELVIVPDTKYLLIVVHDTPPA